MTKRFISVKHSKTRKIFYINVSKKISWYGVARVGISIKKTLAIISRINALIIATDTITKN